MSKRHSTQCSGAGHTLCEELIWYLQECAAHNVRIILLDMERLGPAIDAYAFATRYDFAKAHLHKFEHLYHGTIPLEAVKAVIPATSQRQTFSLDTGVFTIPGDLARESELTYQRRLDLPGTWRYIQASLLSPSRAIVRQLGSSVPYAGSRLS